MSTALHMEAAWVCSRNLQTTSNGSPIARFLQTIPENCCSMLQYVAALWFRTWWKNHGQHGRFVRLGCRPLEYTRLLRPECWGLKRVKQDVILTILYSTKSEADNKHDNWECFDECHVLECKPSWTHLLRSTIASLVLSCKKKCPYSCQHHPQFDSGWFLSALAS